MNLLESKEGLDISETLSKNTTFISHICSRVFIFLSSLSVLQLGKKYYNKTGIPTIVSTFKCKKVTNILLLVK